MYYNEEDVLKKRLEIRDNIAKSLGIDSEASYFEKAHDVGDIHPNGKWVWKEYKPGKFDWRVIKGAGKDTPAKPQPKAEGKKEDDLVNKLFKKENVVSVFKNSKGEVATIQKKTVKEYDKTRKVATGAYNKVTRTYYDFRYHISKEPNSGTVLKFNNRSFANLEKILEKQGYKKISRLEHDPKATPAKPQPKAGEKKEDKQKEPKQKEPKQKEPKRKATASMLDRAAKLPKTVMRTGLSIYPATENDRVAIENLIDNEGYTAEWNEEWGCYFFEEEPDLYDALEREIREGLGHEINCTFEGE